MRNVRTLFPSIGAICLIGAASIGSGRYRNVSAGDTTSLSEASTHLTPVRVVTPGTGGQLSPSHGPAMIVNPFAHQKSQASKPMKSQRDLTRKSDESKTTSAVDAAPSQSVAVLALTTSPKLTPVQPNAAPSRGTGDRDPQANERRVSPANSTAKPEPAAAPSAHSELRFKDFVSPSLGTPSRPVDRFIPFQDKAHSGVPSNRTPIHDIPRTDVPGELPPRKSLSEHISAGQTCAGENPIAPMENEEPSTPEKAIFTSIGEADLAVHEGSPIQVAARQSPVYADTVSGTLAVVADRPIQHDHQCYHRPACGGDCACHGCDNGSLTGALFEPLRAACDSACDGACGGCTMVHGDEKAGLSHGWLLGERCLGFTIGGWIAQSFTANGMDPQIVPFNGPVTFIDRADEYQLNQAYVYFHRPTNTHDRHFDLGGRFDLLYGTDARFRLAQGLDDNIISDADSRFYKMSFPQLYAEVAMNDLAVQVGRFYTIAGYETVTAPDNFFISHSYSMQYAEPFTHTGVLGRYRGARGITLLGGFTRGWDNWEDNNDDLDVIAGLNWTSDDQRRSLSVAVTSGAQDVLGLNDRTLTSIVLEQALGSRLNYVFHTDLGFENNAIGGVQDAEWYSFVQYLTLDINECWSVGGRYEWFADDDGVRVQGLGSPRGLNWTPVAAHWQELALGINYRPCDHWLVRSEARWDWFDSLVPVAVGPFDDFNQDRQFIWSLDLIIGF